VDTLRAAWRHRRSLTRSSCCALTTSPLASTCPAMCASFAVGRRLSRPRLRVARTRHMAALRATVIERAL
jgi:hypothetical protein